MIVRLVGLLLMCGSVAFAHWLGFHYAGWPEALLMLDATLIIGALTVGTVLLGNGGRL